MRRALLHATLTLAAVVAGAQDIRRPPTPADRGRVIADGWTSSGARLEELLTASYQAGAAGRPGSTGNTAWRQWMFLWKWSTLLARQEMTEAIRLTREHLRVAEDGTRNYYATGVPWATDTRPSTTEEAEKALSRAENREKILGALVPADFIDPKDAPLAARLQPEILAEWINDEVLSRLLFENLSPDDYAPAVLARLQEIRLAHPAKFREYRALAVALALVYDQAFPPFWPHHQVDAKILPRQHIAVPDFFDFWVKSNESRALLLDLRTLSPGQLKFLIDAPLEVSEFDWARKNVKLSRNNFAKAFSAVSYDFDRLKRQEFDWPGTSYTLLDLREQGGICVDQAYYATIAGKAHGLPTLYFSGQGTDGGHAWFGYMKTADKWELDCGRYENQNYAVGEALDPQTWQPISDHELAFLSRRFRDKPEFAASQDDLLMAVLLESKGDTVRAAKAFDSAVQVCPENSDAWDAKADFLYRTGAPVNQRRAHFEAAIRQFPNDRDIRAHQQQELAAVLREAGDPRAAETLEKSIVSANKRRRSDLSVTMAAQKLTALAAEKKFDEAFATYRSQLSRLGKTGGGNFFLEITRPFVRALADAGDTARAVEAVSLARKALRPEPGSILAIDLNDLEKDLQEKP